MWTIHGKNYNLTSFLDKHPGGRVILESCQGEKDVTAAFESYHALCDMTKIKEIMRKYEVGSSECKTAFHFSEEGFYYTVKGRVRDYFAKHRLDHHAPWFWWIKIIANVSLYILFFTCAFCTYYFPLHYRMLLAFVAGSMLLQIGLTVMHDASHCAVSKHATINEWISSVWNSFALWDAQMWSRHHAFMHHSFTGTKDDPDTVYFAPFVRKSRSEKAEKYMDISAHAAFYTCFFSVFIPGMVSGQILSYARWYLRKHLWRMPLEVYHVSYFELFLKLLKVCLLLQSKSILTVCAYYVGCNITYFACIVPDHETFETHQNIVTDSRSIDWGELQVKNSANFSTNNLWVNEIFGGINYQIEHHLFPTVYHEHFPKIQPIVEATCKKFNIPYVNHPDIHSAMSSALKMCNYIARDKKK